MKDSTTCTSNRTMEFEKRDKNSVVDAVNEDTIFPRDAESEIGGLTPKLLLLSLRKGEDSLEKLTVARRRAMPAGS